MTKNISMYVSALILTVLFTFGVMAATAFAHAGEDHSASTNAITVTDENRVQVEQMVTILTQLISLLQQQAQMEVPETDEHHQEADTHQEDNHHDMDEEHSLEDSSSQELVVWVELHSNLTHAHVQEPGEDEVSFIIEDISYTEQDAVVAVISERTGLSAHDIEAVIVFPSGQVDERGDSMDEHDEHAEKEVSGIHIMHNGQIMWGNGSIVAGATITTTGDIQLADGDIITPAFDLR